MVIETTQVITRKEHSCWGCGHKFPPKSDMRCTTWVDDGISKSYWCLVCLSFLDENHEDFEEGVTFGEFKGEPVYEEFKKKYYEKN